MQSKVENLEVYSLVSLHFFFNLINLKRKDIWFKHISSGWEIIHLFIFFILAILVVRHFIKKLSKNLHDRIYINLKIQWVQMLDPPFEIYGAPPD